MKAPGAPPGAPLHPLAGNGVALVRERALAKAVQNGLERLYQLDRVVDVDDFLEEARGGEREALLVREGDDGALEMALRIPSLARRELSLEDADLDPLCQIIEGVSHFVYLTERARQRREATQLELEAQAEVDKYVVLAASLPALHGHKGLSAGQSVALRERIFASARYRDGEGTELGERYRVASAVAEGFVRRLEREYVAPARPHEMRFALRQFHRAGQEGKMRAARG